MSSQSPPVDQSVKSSPTVRIGLDTFLLISSDLRLEPHRKAVLDSRSEVLLKYEIKLPVLIAVSFIAAECENIEKS